MANPRTTSGSRTRAWAVPVALLGWTVLIVVGAGPRPADSTWLGLKHVEAIIIGVFSLWALVGLVILLLFRPTKGTWTEPQKKSRNTTWLLALVALSLLVWRPQVLGDLIAEDQQVGEPAVALPSEVNEEVTPREPVAQATDVLLVLAASGVAVAVWMWTRSQRRAGVAIAPDPIGVDETDELVTAIDRAQHHLRVGEDPRAAVLQAYASLEVAVAERGVVRSRHETSTEHMRRALGDLPIDAAPLVRLGELYEVARFSSLPVTIDDQRQAGEALGRARDELAAVL